MKTITDALKRDIEDASTGGLLKSLPPAVMEKDFHITDILHLLSGIRFTHSATLVNRVRDDARPAECSVATHLVFAGGTCLSKAHGLIERMSEDIDIKVILDDVPADYKLEGNKAERSRLKDLHSHIEAKLQAEGFTFKETRGINPVARDKHRYYCLAIDYQAKFNDVSGSLRPELKLELIHRPPLLPHEQRQIGYLWNKLIPEQDAIQFEMSAISVAETLAEKVLSLLRRCAWYWDGHQRGDFDHALVRHIYDVWRINVTQPESLEAAQTLFEQLIRKDQSEFNGQHPNFDADPVAVLKQALTRARTDTGLRSDYTSRLLPMLFAETKPGFDESFAAFDQVASALLGHLE